MKIKTILKNKINKFHNSNNKLKIINLNVMWIIVTNNLKLKNLLEII